MPPYLCFSMMWCYTSVVIPAPTYVSNQWDLPQRINFPQMPCCTLFHIGQCGMVTSPWLLQEVPLNPSSHPPPKIVFGCCDEVPGLICWHVPSVTGAFLLPLWTFPPVTFPERPAPGLRIAACFPVPLILGERGGETSQWGCPRTKYPRCGIGRECGRIISGGRGCALHRSVQSLLVSWWCCAHPGINVWMVAVMKVFSHTHHTCFQNDLVCCRL